MKWTPDRCLQCGTTQRRSFTASIPNDVIYPDGSILGMCFWFCLDDCFLRGIQSFMDKRFHFDRNPLDDPDVPDHHIEEWLQWWYREQIAAFFQATVRLANEATDHYAIHMQRKTEQVQKLLEQKKTVLAKIQDREAARLERALEREVTRLQRLQDNEDRRQQQLEDRQREKEEARLAKEQEAEAQRQAEEERMRELLVSKPIPQHLRYQHTHILGPSGSGKSTLLTNIFLRDIQSESPPAYVIVDPKGSLIRRLSRLKIFTQRLRDRLVVVDALEHPAMNLFDARGQNPAQIISSFSYIFGTTNTKLTGKQLPCFAFCVSLLFRIPGADLFMLQDLLDDGVKKRDRSEIFKNAIEAMTAPQDRAMRRFFENDYYSESYASTRQEIKTRLWSVLSNSDLFSILNAPERRLDLAQCIRDRKIVLVNTRMVELEEAHVVFGRFIIALFNQAVQARTETHPAYLMVDEFQDFADSDRMPRILRLIREYNAGAIIAHQNMFCNELDDASRSAISTNTAIKYASKPAGRDVGYVSSDMLCDSEFLTKQCVQTDTHGRFACTFTGLQHPFIAEVPFGEINNWPAMTDHEYAGFNAANKRMLHSPARKHEAPQQSEASRNRNSTPAQADEPIVPTYKPPAREARTTPQTMPPANNADPPHVSQKHDPGEPVSEW